MAPKCDLSGKDGPPGKKLTRKSITLEQQMGVLRMYDGGESTAAIRNELNLLESMSHTIRKDKKITAAFKAGAGSFSPRVSSGQSTFMVRLEKMLITWVDHRNHQGLNVTFDNTKKTMEWYHHLKAKETDPLPTFVARTGWFYNFKARCAFRNVKCSGEAKSTDADAAASYLDELRAIIFNMDEMDLQWKKMPDRTYITKEKSAPGFKAFKDHFTLLLEANLMGDCKLKPVLVYPAENPRALKGYDKNILPVH